MNRINRWLSNAAHWLAPYRGRCLRAEEHILELERELAVSQRARENAHDRAVRATAERDALRTSEAEARKETIAALKAVANFHVIAAGSRVPIFDGAGPTLQPVAVEAPLPDAMSKPRASQFVRQQRSAFLQDLESKRQAEVETMLNPQSEVEVSA